MLSAVRCLKTKLFFIKDTILWKVFEETIIYYAFQQFRKARNTLKQYSQCMNTVLQNMNSHWKLLL